MTTLDNSEDVVLDMLARIETLKEEIAELSSNDNASTSPTWTGVSFDNGWVDYDGTHEVQYTLNNGIVRLQGWAKDGTINTNIFALPSGFRPAQDLRFIQYSFAAAGTIGLIRVNATGDVLASDPGDNTLISLDGINFFNDGS